LGSGRTDHYRSWTASAGISALHLFFIFRVELRYEIWPSTVVSTRRKFRLRCVGLRLGFFQLLSHEAWCVLQTGNSKAAQSLPKLDQQRGPQQA
jgi:hypothetical protein